MYILQASRFNKYKNYPIHTSIIKKLKDVSWHSRQKKTSQLNSMKMWIQKRINVNLEWNKPTQLYSYHYFKALSETKVLLFLEI